MRELEEFGDADDGTVFRDVIMLALLGFMTIVVLLLPHINPPTQAAASTVEPPGNLIVEASWPEGTDTDVDLWTEAPGERPVGYSNQGGAVFNLLRDDMGKVRDSTGLNYEVAYSRGMPQGSYTVNVHLYREEGATLPVPVDVVVKMKRDADGPAQELVRKTVQLRHPGEEITVSRFDLDGQGRLVPGSMHDMPRSLRSAAPNGG